MMNKTLDDDDQQNNQSNLNVYKQNSATQQSDKNYKANLISSFYNIGESLKKNTSAIFSINQINTTDRNITINSS